MSIDRFIFETKLLHVTVFLRRSNKLDTDKTNSNSPNQVIKYIYDNLAIRLENHNNDSVS